MSLEAEHRALREIHARLEQEAHELRRENAELRRENAELRGLVTDAKPLARWQETIGRTQYSRNLWAEWVKTAEKYIEP